MATIFRGQLRIQKYGIYFSWELRSMYCSRLLLEKLCNYDSLDCMNNDQTYPNILNPEFYLIYVPLYSCVLHKCHKICNGQHCRYLGHWLFPVKWTNTELRSFGQFIIKFLIKIKKFRLTYNNRWITLSLRDHSQSALTNGFQGLR